MGFQYGSSGDNGRKNGVTVDYDCDPKTAQSLANSERLSRFVGFPN
jgi:hypothetical protein